MEKLIANRFEIQDLLGRGGMGEVYRATDTQTGETVAVKALNPEILDHARTLPARKQCLAPTQPSQYCPHDFCGGGTRAALHRDGVC